MQQWHEEEQQPLLHLQEAAEVYCVKYTAQKIRREAEGYEGEEEEEEKNIGVPPTTLR